MTGRIVPADGRLHRATARVPEHHDESRAEMFDRVFNASEFVIADHFSRRADHKKITNVLIENNLGRRARIRTADNDGKRMLRPGGLGSPGPRRFRTARRGGDEAGVAGFECCQSGTGFH